VALILYLLNIFTGGESGCLGYHFKMLVKLKSDKPLLTRERVKHDEIYK